MDYFKVIKKIRIANLLGVKFYILAGTPLHSNIGDRAIAYTEMKFLKKRTVFPVIEIPYGFDLSRLPRISTKAIILLHGGGNLGDLWFNEEEYRREIMDHFRLNKIVMFPQTVFFNETSNLEDTVNIYGKHKKMTITAREKTSYEIMRKNFANDSIIIPDIVMSFNYRRSNDRRGALFIMRDDKEKTLTESNFNIVKKSVEDVFKSYVTFSDMDLKLSYEDSAALTHKDITMKKLDEYSRHSIVLTDRLHGMIFSLITGTPCIVFGSQTYKTTGVYKWIEKTKYSRYIKLCEDIKDFDDIFTELVNSNERYDYDPRQFSEYWKKLSLKIFKNS